MTSTTTSSPFKAADSGLLLVYMEPGSSVTLQEFHEWYDNEHVPLRIERFPTFKSAVRYQVTETTLHPDPSGPTSESVGPPKTSWGAFYTVSSNATFADQAYTSLRSQRSEREAELFTRLGIVDRRIYKLEYDSDTDPNLSSESSIGMKPQLAASTPPYLVANSVNIKSEVQEEYNRWFDTEHVPLLSKIQGWRRSRRFTLIDNGVNGTLAQPGNAEAVSRTLGLHEYDTPNIEQTKEYKDACNTEWRTKVLGPNSSNLLQRERKVCKIYRAWDPIAAIKAEKQQEQS